jgi:hypothetical protein
MTSVRDSAAEAAPALPTQEEVAERQRRFDALLAARAALPEAVASRASSLAESARSISTWLAKLTEHLRSTGAGYLGAEAIAREAPMLRDALERLDADLRSYAAQLRRLLDESPSSELLTGLTASVPHERDHAIAILDLVLEDEANLAARCELLDHLATWLSTDEREGRRRVVLDPAVSAARVLSVAQRVAGASVDPVAAEREFVEAASRCAEGDLEPIVREMNARKAELGLAIFAPSVLRAVVFYNTAVWNRALDAGGDARARTEAEADAGTRDSDAVGATAGAGEAEPDTGLDAAEPTPAIRAILEKPPAAPVRAPEPPRSRSHWFVTAASLTLVALAAAFVWLESVDNAVRELPSDRVRSLSPQLASAYRDRSGVGSLFIGSVGSDWRHLSIADRESSAQKLTATLQREGVREIILYDADHRVAVHYAKGLPLHVAR